MNKCSACLGRKKDINRVSTSRLESWFQLSMGSEFSGCGHHSHVCAPISHVFIFLNISEKYSTAGLPKKVRSCRLPLLYSCILSYCIYPTASVHFAPCEEGQAKLSALLPNTSTPNSEWSSSRPTRPRSSFTQTWKQTPRFASRLPGLQQREWAK